MNNTITIEFQRRECVVNYKDGKKLGFFHQWEQWSNVIGESPLIGGHSAGQISQVYGIVEFSDGSVKRVEPTLIRFVDMANKDIYYFENSTVGKKLLGEEE